MFQHDNQYAPGVQDDNKLLNPTLRSFASLQDDNEKSQSTEYSLPEMLRPPIADSSMTLPFITLSFWGPEMVRLKNLVERGN